MICRLGVMTTTALFVVLGLAVSSAHACGAHADWAKLATLPGAWVMNLHASLAIAALAAVIERPFLSWAGISRHALAHSLVASAISFLLVNVGGAIAMVFLGAVAELLLLLWIPSSVMLSVWIKVAWLNQVRSVFHGEIHSLPILAGVIVSNIAIACLPIWQSLFGFDGNAWAWQVQDIRRIVAIGTIPAAVLVLTLASRRIAADWNHLAADRARGFDVLPGTTPLASISNVTPSTTA